MIAHENPRPLNEPDYRRGYLRVPLALWLALYCRAPLTRRQLQLVSVVIRESWGWQTPGGAVYLWTRPLSPRQLAQATGLTTDHLRRDIRTLVERGVLREQGWRYQVVPDPGAWRLWKSAASRAASPPGRRSAALKPPGKSDETALPAPALKKANTGNRNAASPTGSELPPSVDNRPRPRSITKDHLDQPSAGATARSAAGPRAASRLLAIVTLFTGPLSPQITDGLRRWIARDGAAAVWRTLEPYLKKRPSEARRAIEVQVGKRVSGTDTGPEQPETREADG